MHMPGNLLGLALSPMLLARFGWRALFLIYGILGGPLLAMWLAAVPDTLRAGKCMFLNYPVYLSAFLNHEGPIVVL